MESVRKIAFAIQIIFPLFVPGQKVSRHIYYQDIFVDGLTEELLNTLVRIRELKVLGRTSSFAYKGVNKDLKIIASELEADYLIEGSVRKSGNNLRITVQLNSGRLYE